NSPPGPPPLRTATAEDASCEGACDLQRLPGADDFGELALMAAVAAVAVWMVEAHQLRIAQSHRVQVGVLTQAEDAQRLPLLGRKARHLAARHSGSEARRDGVERILEVRPGRARVAAGPGEGAGPALPARDRRLRRLDLVGAHAVEEIVAGVVLADVIEAQPAPIARPVEVAGAERSAKLARRTAPGHGAMRRRAFKPPMPFSCLARHASSTPQPPYIGPSDRRLHRTRRRGNAPQARSGAR